MGSSLILWGILVGSVLCLRVETTTATITTIYIIRGVGIPAAWVAIAFGLWLLEIIPATVQKNQRK